jgi:pimeloyl-ACP methyl ester carboxylesterase
LSREGDFVKRLAAAAVAAFGLLASPAVAAPAKAPAVPRAVIADPAPDPSHPTDNAQVLVPSGDVGMNALFMLASGSGPHPTVVLFHGFPGNEQNLDLAQAIRRAGWNVLTLHYRGSWGSPGTFSLGGVMDDARAADAFVHDPKVAAKFHIDTRRIVLAGHSMGGFAAETAALDDPTLAGVVLLDAWNVGATGAQFAKLQPAGRHAAAEKAFDDLGNSLAGTNAAVLSDEIAAHAADWDTLAWAPRLARPPMLIVGAARAGGAENAALAKAIAKAGGRVRNVTLPTDHPFSDHRIALAAIVVDWLQKLPR